MPNLKRNFSQNLWVNVNKMQYKYVQGVFFLLLGCFTATDYAALLQMMMMIIVTNNCFEAGI